MSGFINSAHRIDRRWRISRGRGDVRESDLPLDHRLTFSPEPDQRWTYEDDRIFFNDEDVREIVGNSGNDIGILCGVSQGLFEYQQFIWGRGGKEFAKFNGAVASIQDTVVGRLGALYDGLTGGVRFECDGDDFWINNVNVRSVLALYRLRPTDKARRYLLGLQQKLGLILSRQQSSTRYDGVHDQASRLHFEIQAALEHLPADAPPCLCDGRRSA